MLCLLLSYTKFCDTFPCLGNIQDIGVVLKCFSGWDEKQSHKLLERQGLVKWEVGEDVSSVVKKELHISSYK